jgi:hypothetical protein
MIVKDAITLKATTMIQLPENASKDNPNSSLIQVKYVWNIIWKATIPSHGQVVR